MRLHSPQAKALAEEASRHIPDEPISSAMTILGRNTVPHVYEAADGRMWLRFIGRGVTAEVTMTPAQLRSLAGQAERVLLAHDLKASA